MASSQILPKYEASACMDNLERDGSAGRKSFGFCKQFFYELNTFTKGLSLSIGDADWRILFCQSFFPCLIPPILLLVIRVTVAVAFGFFFSYDFDRYMNYTQLSDIVVSNELRYFLYLTNWGMLLGVVIPVVLALFSLIFNCEQCITLLICWWKQAKFPKRRSGQDAFYSLFVTAPSYFDARETKEVNGGLEVDEDIDNSRSLSVAITRDCSNDHSKILAAATCSHKHNLVMKIFIGLTWLLYTLSIDLILIIVVLYWFLVEPNARRYGNSPKPLDFAHFYNLFFFLIIWSTSNIPIPFYHMLYGMVAGCLYVCVLVTVYLLPLDVTGIGFVYHVMNFETNLTTCIVICVSSILILIPASHFLHYFLFGWYKNCFILPPPGVRQIAF